MRARVPLAAGTLSLLGALAATLFLYFAAARALDRSLDERLRGAGEAAAQLLAQTAPSADRLRALMQANQLEGVFIVDGSLRVIADAAGGPVRRVDLLRIDADKLQRALQGEPSVGAAYSLGDAAVITGYFPIPAAAGAAPTVLALEAGQAFAEARRGLRSALLLGVLLCLGGALALALVAARWSRAEAARSEAAGKAARGELLSQMAAIAAHEIRNPLAVIRGNVELMRELSAGHLSERDLGALADVLGEVERLRRLSDDFLDLAADRPLVRAPLDLSALLEDAARAAEASFPEVRVRRSFGALLAVEGDAARLRQVFSNLLTNAAQAQQRGEVELQAQAAGSEVSVVVRDQGPGVPAEVRARLFDPFVTTRSSGTGLGLAICRRLVERHGGSVSLLQDRPTGATFEVRLPAVL